MYPTIYPVYPFIIFPIKMKEQVCPLNIKSWVDKNNLSYDEGHSFIGAHAGSIVKQQKNDRYYKSSKNLFHL
mgnify:CR=1 FL=1